MSLRKLGGGRILGSGKGLAPPQDAVQSHRHPRSPSPSSRALHSDTSSPSLGSQTASNDLSGLSSSPLPTPLLSAGQDLTANISLAAPSARDEGQLQCPICNEEMVTLLQLNRHIDDIHQELPEVQQDEVKTWFDKQVQKAKKFQPLSIINQKLRGLEVFESNDSSSSIATPTYHNSGGPARHTPEPSADPDELITRRHWQRPTAHDSCTDPTCGKGLGPINGNVNCRSCGKLFCETHTMYQMKLSRSANYEPLRGLWARVCETCYKSRPGYNDHHGAEAELTAEFSAIRKKRVERQNLEISRLEKRLTRLTQLLADPPPEMLAAAGLGGGNGTGSSLLSPMAALSGQKNLRKIIEQSIVAWENDASVPRCPFCQQDFGTWTFRRHHCRLCGRVVCADQQTGCSSEIGFSVSSRNLPNSASPSSGRSGPGRQEKAGPADKVDVDIRLCRECKSTVFSKRDFQEALLYKPADQKAFETLRQFEWGIRQMMPLFQRSLLALQADETGPSTTPATRAQIRDAAKIRKRLMESFTKYNLAAVRMRDLKTDSASQKRLQKAVYSAASTFLHANMVPLKHVPKMLRSGQAGPPSSKVSSPHRRLLTGLNGSGSASPLRYGEAVGDPMDSASVAGSEVSTAVSLLETEEKELREKLIVLEEQRYIVKQMVDNAHGSRRFEEVGALTRNVEELDAEIERIKSQVNNVEERWEGLYAAGEA